MTAAPAFTFNVNMPSVAVGDFNGDGKTDIAVMSQGGSTVTMLPGKGDGTFGIPLTSQLVIANDPAYGLFGDIGVADFDGDGRLDLALMTLRTGNAPVYIAVARGQGNGLFGDTRLTLGSASSIRAADINGDQIPDLISSYGVNLGNGDGTFQPVIGLPGAPNPVVADVNHDGSLDILGFNLSGVATLLNMTQAPPDLTVVSAASFVPNSLAPGSIAAAFGQNIASTMQAGITVTVQDSAGTSRLAPLFFTSQNQVNFLVPAATAAGPATITIAGGIAGRPLSAQTQIATVAPALFTVSFGYAAAYAIRVSPSGSQTYLPLFTTPQNIAGSTAIDLSQPGQVYLVLYGTGFDAARASSVTATVQGVSAPVRFAGAVPSFPGLDQLNLLLPASLAGTGVASVSVSIAGQTCNTALVTIR